jgi:hypothetical protein
MSLFLLYFIILSNLCCAETLNIVLSFIPYVRFIMALLLVFPEMWRFPYPFGFCNPVRIYGRNINDDDDNHDELKCEHESIGKRFKKEIQQGLFCLILTKINFTSKLLVQDPRQVTNVTEIPLDGKICGRKDFPIMRSFYVLCENSAQRYFN